MGDTIVLAAIPSPPQGAWQIGGFSLRAYALCIMTGIIVAYWWTRRRYVAKGGDATIVDDALLIAVPAGIIGARLYHVATDYHKYFGEGNNPLDILKIWQGGLGIWGGIALGSLSVAAYLKYKKVSIGDFADSAAPAVILAQGIGRLGNWFNQELYGGPSDKPWALEIYQRVDSHGYTDMLNGHSTGEVIATVQPTFLYELLWNFAVVAFLLFVEKKFRVGQGRLFLYYIAAYTCGRFFIEGMRTDEATMIGGWRINEVVSLIVFSCAVIALIVTKKLFKEEESEERNSTEKSEMIVD